MGVVVRIRVEADRVVLTGSRVWARASRAADGLRLDTATAADPQWRRVDDDLHRLYRAGLRLVATDRTAAREFVTGACALVDLDPVDPDPARQLVRAVWPLLAGEPGMPLPAVPPALPAWMGPAFRERTPRSAARWLFTDRATRPVVRALCTRLGDDPPDLFALSVSVAASRHLEPDHVARILSVVPPHAGSRAPLHRGELSGLATLLGEAHPRRAVTWLTDALASPELRARLRFVAATRTAGGPGLGDADGWEGLARAVALAPPEVVAS